MFKKSKKQPAPKKTVKQNVENFAGLALLCYGLVVVTRGIDSGITWCAKKIVEGNNDRKAKAESAKASAAEAQAQFVKDFQSGILEENEENTERMREILKQAKVKGYASMKFETLLKNVAEVIARAEATAGEAEA